MLNYALHVNISLYVNVSFDHPLELLLELSPGSVITNPRAAQRLLGLGLGLGLFLV